MTGWEMDPEGLRGECVFRDSDCLVYEGDCGDVLSESNLQAALILTSPPYDHLRDYGGHGFDFDRVADCCVGNLRDGGVIVWVVTDATVDGSETGTSFRQALGFMERGLSLHDTMIYRKAHGVPIENKGRYRNIWEYMFVFSKGRPSVFNPIMDKRTVMAGGESSSAIRQPEGHIRMSTSPHVIPPFTKRDNIWEYAAGYNQSHPNFPEAHKHPATFPYALAYDHIITWTNPGDLVVDPMAGSGTVLRAAKDSGRMSLGVEIHSDYVEIIKHRLAQRPLGL